MPLIECKETVKWSQIFEEIKTQLPGRTRFTNFLNPNWETSTVGTTEKEEILRNFGEYGFKFSLYENRKRSVTELRKFIAKHIDDIHQSATSKSICSFFYEKLAESLRFDGDSISKNDWMDICCNGNEQLKIAYKYIVEQHRSHLATTYGIIIDEDRRVSINHGAIYSVMSKRKRFSLTADDITYLDELIAKYRKIDHRSMPVKLPLIFDLISLLD